MRLRICSRRLRRGFREMEPVGLISVIAGSFVLLALLASIAITGISKRNSDNGSRVIHAIDSKWRKLKVEIAT